MAASIPERDETVAPLPSMEQDTAVHAGIPAQEPDRKTRRRRKSPQVSRRELIERAFERVKEELDSDRKLDAATIGHLEKLLRIDRDMLQEEDVVREIRVLWQADQEESSSDA